MIKKVPQLLLLFLFPGTQNNEHLSITKSSYASILYLYLYLYLWFPALWTMNTCLLKVLKCINWCQSLSAVARFCTTTENTFQQTNLQQGIFVLGQIEPFFLEMFQGVGIPQVWVTLPICLAKQNACCWMLVTAMGQNTNTLCLDAKYIIAQIHC